MRSYQVLQPTPLLKRSPPKPRPIDETGEIRVCCFNDVAKRFSDMIQTGMVR